MLESPRRSSLNSSEVVRIPKRYSGHHDIDCLQQPDSITIMATFVPGIALIDHADICRNPSNGLSVVPLGGCRLEDRVGIHRILVYSIADDDNFQCYKRRNFPLSRAPQSVQIPYLAQRQVQHFFTPRSPWPFQKRGSVAFHLGHALLD